LSGLAWRERQHDRIVGIGPGRILPHAANRSGGLVESSFDDGGALREYSAPKSITQSKIGQGSEKHHDLPITHCKTGRKAGDKSGRFRRDFRKFFESLAFRVHTLTHGHLDDGNPIRQPAID
jgi:hypothetical protein